jgi:3-isopropylmalate/(R)-2-methylmalate dehydratase small subunit
MRAAEQQTGNTLTIDLRQQIIVGTGFEVSFAIDSMRKDALLHGLDAIGQTLTLHDEILAFQEKHFKANPWFR